MLYGPRGEVIAAADKPKFQSRGELEGTADFRHYRNAVEYAILCAHCGSIASGVLHIHDPRLAKSERTWNEKLELQNECIKIAQRRHQCNIFHENKRDASEWLEEISKR